MVYILGVNQYVNYIKYFNISIRELSAFWLHSGHGTSTIGFNGKQAV